MGTGAREFGSPPWSIERPVGKGSRRAEIARIHLFPAPPASSAASKQPSPSPLLQPSGCRRWGTGPAAGRRRKFSGDIRRKGLSVKSCLFETTPQGVSQEISKFCEGIVPGGVPVLVPVRPAPGAEVNRCHVNVACHVKENGGEAAFGWIIWQSRVLLHAEAHCNWRSPQGELIDITPKADREGQVLFLPDPNMQWEGRMIPSCRVARNQWLSVCKLIQLHEQIDQLQARHRPGDPVSLLDVKRLLLLQMEAAWRSSVIERRSFASAKSSGSPRGRQDRRKAQRSARKRTNK